MADGKKSYWCLLIFVILFFLSSALFWVGTIAVLNSPPGDTSGIGAALGEALGKAVVGALGMVFSIGLTIVFAILLIVYIIVKSRNK